MQAYRIITIEASSEIPHLSGLCGQWYRYEIANDLTSITGYRCGTLSEVKDYVLQNLRRMNLPFQHKGGVGVASKPYLKPVFLHDHPLYS